jgi:type II secretory pathway pseudopilin PulG
MSPPLRHALAHRRRLDPDPMAATAFTLVELIVAAAILVIVSAASFPNLVRFYEGQKLRQAAIELQSHLRRGRTLARRLQSSCTLAIGNSPTVQVTGSGSCTRANLSPLNLTQLIDVRGLCINSSGSAASGCTPPANLSFLPLGVLAGAPRTLYVFGTGTPAQACVDLNLTQIRVGFRAANTGACTYSRS